VESAVYRLSFLVNHKQRMIHLSRLSDRPVLRPRDSSPWEKGAVFNCAAYYERGLIHLVYRATDRPSAGEPFISCLGYAVSSDGIQFNRLDQPIFRPQGSQEARGAEDPRIVKLERTFYMLYTGYSGSDFKICCATSTNLIQWTRHGVVLDEQNKDASFFPERLDGRYLLIHRRAPSIWLTESPDLKPGTTTPRSWNLDRTRPGRAARLAWLAPPCARRGGG
jgi:predicted GH43/DUF377 family glycosyl hydrolase